MQNYIDQIRKEQLPPNFLNEDWPIPQKLDPRTTLTGKIIYPKQAQALGDRIYNFKYF